MGVDPHLLIKLTGHRNIWCLIENYQEATDEDKLEVALAMGSAINGKKNGKNIK